MKIPKLPKIPNPFKKSESKPNVCDSCKKEMNGVSSGAGPYRKNDSDASENNALPKEKLFDTMTNKVKSYFFRSTFLIQSLFWFQKNKKNVVFGIVGLLFILVMIKVAPHATENVAVGSAGIGVVGVSTYAIGAIPNRIGMFVGKILGIFGKFQEFNFERQGPGPWFMGIISLGILPVIYFFGKFLTGLFGI
jgi:hypothetical protein